MRKLLEALRVVGWACRSRRLAAAVSTTRGAGGSHSSHTGFNRRVLLLLGKEQRSPTNTRGHHRHSSLPANPQPRTRSHHRRAVPSDRPHERGCKRHGGPAPLAQGRREGPRSSRDPSCSRPALARQQRLPQGSPGKDSCAGDSPAVGVRRGSPGEARSPLPSTGTQPGPAGPADSNAGHGPPVQPAPSPRPKGPLLSSLPQLLMPPSQSAGVSL